MAALATYASTPVGALAQVTTANTSVDGTGTLGTTMMNVIQGSANGTRIDTISIIAAGTIATDTMLRFFLFDGANTKLWKEVPIKATTADQYTQNYAVDLTNLGLILPNNNWYLRATIHTNNYVNIAVTQAGAF